MSVVFNTNETKNKKTKVLCSTCKTGTNHTVLTSINEKGKEEWDEGYFFYWDNDYEIIQCLGCDTISFRTSSVNSEESDPHGETLESVHIYPQRDKSTLTVKPYMNVPYNLRRIYNETINSYNSDNLTLCGVGIRGLVEGICKENDVTDGNVPIISNDGTPSLDSDGIPRLRRTNNLQGKINGLHERGKLTEKNADLLHEHRFLGNEAVHELSVPSKEKLALAIDIIENVFDTLYEIPSKGLRLKRKRLES